jgi:SET domain-containing protein
MYIRVTHASHLKPQAIPIKEFEELFGIRYLPHLTFSDYTIEKWVKKKCAKAYKNSRLADYTRWLGHLHKKQLEQPLLPDCSIRWISPKIGYGLFTECSLEAAEFVGEYTGILRPRNQPFANVNDYCFMYPRAWMTTRPLTIDSEKCGNHTRFINHSDRPNLEALSVFFEGMFRIIFRTTEAIAAGTQLTYDYGALYWRQRKKLPQ